MKSKFCLNFFTNKTLTIQQYDPNNTAVSYSAYDVRELINNRNGVIMLANLSGAYASEVPYAYFKLGFS